MSSGSWLCPTELDRSRLVDASDRVHMIRRVGSGAVTVALVISAPWIGWWTLGLMALSGLNFMNVERRIHTSAHPERVSAFGIIITILAPTGVLPGSILSAQPGTWSAPAEAGAISYGYQWQDCDTQGDNCQAIGGAQSAAYMATASDAGHTLRVALTATDSDGLTSATSAASSSVPAAEAPGSSTTPGTNGSPNGSGASESAQLRLSTPGAFTRPFARRAFRLAGRLVDSKGDPIAAASLDVLAHTAGAYAPTLIGRIRTNATGSFSTVVPPGPSRLIVLAYRAFSGDSGYAARAQVRESVSAGVQLSVSPRRASSTGTITLSGRVVGPIPSQGVIVGLLVHYRGHWEPFRTPRTDGNGRFSVIYQFQGSVGRFAFRAEVFGGQSGLPYTTGTSTPVDVSAN
jgi:hypothetical protein